MFIKFEELDFWGFLCFEFINDNEGLKISDLCNLVIVIFNFCGS